MSDPATISAPCKVNLFLDILGVRADGFHELDTLFMALPEPCDRLDIRPGAPGSGLALTASDPSLADESNTVHKAYRAFSQATGFAPDIQIYLDKKIPTGAGLGGGSSDAAALLRHLCALAGDEDPRLVPDREALISMAASVGADVPFFLMDGPARAGGIGEILEPAQPDLSGLHLLLVCPEEHVSTPWAFKAWDDLAARKPLSRGTDSLTWLPRQIKRPLCFRLWLRNSFEEAVFHAYPKLRKYKEKLLLLGAAGAVMSGSGASLLALFRQREAAQKAQKAFSGGGSDAFLHSF